MTVNQASLHSNLNSSYRFNGTSGVVTVPDHADFNLGTGAISIEWWFNAAGAGAGTRGDFFTYKGGTGDFGIHFDATGQIDVYHTAFIQDGGASVSRDAWHHVVFTKEAGTAANNATLYLDGGVYANFTDTQSFTIPGNILFGSNTGALFFNGRLDEFAIYNTALSAFDVAQHYAAATAVPVPEPSTFALLGMGLVGLNVRRRRKSPSRKAGGTGVQNVVTRNVAGLAAALVLALWAAGSQAAFLTPVGVTANGNIDANAVIANTINHNGLTAVGTHSSTFATQNFWRTNSAAGTLSITYDLGAQFNLNSMRIWNYNESGTGGGGAPNTDRGINNLTVSYSKDNVEFFKAEDFSLAQASGLATYSGQVKNFGKINTGVRYVKFDVIDSHGSNNGLTGLSEVRFNTTNAEIVPTSVTVNQTANGGATFGIENLTNDSGMIGFGNEQSDEADGGNGFAGQWRQSTGGGNVLANSQITFDLGTNRTIGAIKIWNFHESGQTDRGIDEIDLYQSDDGISYSLIGNYDLTQQTGAQSVLHDVIDLNGLGVSAQFLRFDVAGNFGDGGFYGLGEVRFFAAAATIPEPGSLLLLCLGLAGLATRRPSRIRSGAGR